MPREVLARKKYAAAAAMIAPSISLRRGEVGHAGSSSSFRTATSAGGMYDEWGALRCSVSHWANPGTGDSVTNVVSRGSSRFSSSTTCLIRKFPKEMPARPRWQLDIE